MSDGISRRSRIAVYRMVAAMRLHLFLVLACVAGMSAVSKYALTAPVYSRVHASEICWDPDVEFPVPCDDDDD